MAKVRGAVLTSVVNLAGLGVVLFLLLRPAGPMGAKLASWSEERDLANLLKSEWQPLAADGHRLHSSSKMPVLVEFLDYQCPICRAQHATLRRAGLDSFLVVRHFPLPYHPHAKAAARAALCAEAQGRMEAMHNLLLETTDWQGNEKWDQLRKSAGVTDSAKFEACLTAEATDSLIDRDMALGSALGVEGTPTFFTTNRRFTGLLMPEQLREMLPR